MLDGVITGDSSPVTEREVEAVPQKAQAKVKKPSMSFGTAFMLSLKNLFTKKGRTTLTAFAGSIGIIGIALILAISQGMTTYIDTVQEEALSCGVPTLVTRDCTERPEGIEAGGLRLVGSDGQRIYAEVCNLLDDAMAYERMRCRRNPFGDGHAAERIAEIIGNVI